MTSSKIGCLFATCGGSAVIEFAMVAPVFLMLVFGCIEFGRLLWTQQALQQTAIAGVRCMAIAQGAPKQLVRVERQLQRDEHEELHRDDCGRMGIVGQGRRHHAGQRCDLRWHDGFFTGNDNEHFQYPGAATGSACCRRDKLDRDRLLS